MKLNPTLAATLSLAALTVANWVIFSHRAEAQNEFGTGTQQIVPLAAAANTPMFVVNRGGSWRVYAVHNHPRFGYIVEPVPSSLREAEEKFNTLHKVNEGSPARVFGHPGSFAEKAPNIPGLGEPVRATGEELEVEIVPGNPGVGYESELWLVSPGTPRRLSSNRKIGDVASLGKFPKGTELIFEIRIEATGKSYRSGPASQNRDGMAHAAVKRMPNGEIMVGFEDIGKDGDGTFPQPDYTYDDLLFRIRPVSGKK